MSSALQTECQAAGTPPNQPQTSEFVPKNRPGLVRSTVDEEAEAGLCLLPGGYIDDDGAVHREAVLRPLTGLEEEWLIGLAPDACAASVITGLLTRCLVRVGRLSPVSRAVAREMLVGDREYLIMKLREMNCGTRVNAVIKCSNPGCEKPMDVSFSLGDLDVERRPMTQRFFSRPLASGCCDVTQREVEFRLPTGADQEDLSPIFQEDETAAAGQLLARCVRRIGEFASLEAVPPELSDSLRREIAGEMERLAPHVDVELETTCPECNTVCVTSFDLPAFILAEMKSGLPYLEHEIHALAWHYHWSERDVLSLTRKKRKRYVELVSQELDRTIGLA